MKTSIALAALIAGLASGSVTADPRSELVDAFQKAMADGSYRMNIQSSAGPDTMLEVQLPDRFHMKNPQSEMVMLPGGTWINAGGRWMKVPMDMSRITQGYTEQAMKEGINALQDVQYLGEESVDGCSSRHYSYAVRGNFMGVSANSDAQAWVCGDSGMPIKVVSTDKGNTVTISYDFDAAVNIQAPD